MNLSPCKARKSPQMSLGPFIWYLLWLNHECYFSWVHTLASTAHRGAFKRRPVMIRLSWLQLGSLGALVECTGLGQYGGTKPTTSGGWVGPRARLLEIGDQTESALGTSVRVWLPGNLGRVGVGGDLSRGRSLRLLLPPGAGRAGPQGLSDGAAGTELRPRSPHLALGSPRPGRWLSAGIGGEPRRENVTSAGSGGRRGEAARTCPCPSAPPATTRPRAPPPPAPERRARAANMTSAFKLDFLPDMMVEGRLLVPDRMWVWPPGRPRVTGPEPRGGRGRAVALLSPGDAGGGSGSAAPCGSELALDAGWWERVWRSGGDQRAGRGARGGAESVDRWAGRGFPGSGLGVRPARTGERGAASQGGVRACTLVSFEIRGCWSSRGPFKYPFLPNCSLLWLTLCKNCFLRIGEWKEGRKKKGGGR